MCVCVCVCVCVEITSEVTRRIARAARAFGCLRVPVFKNKDLSLVTKRRVNRVVVLAVLLYGAETWTMKAAYKTFELFS